MVTAINIGYSSGFAIMLVTYLYLRRYREYNRLGHITLAAGIVAIAFIALLLAIFTGSAFSALLAAVSFVAGGVIVLSALRTAGPR